MNTFGGLEYLVSGFQDFKDEIIFQKTLVMVLLLVEICSEKI